MATITLITREYADKKSRKEVNIRFRIRTSKYDKSYQSNITSTIANICQFGSNLQPIDKKYNTQLLSALRAEKEAINSILSEHQSYSWDKIKKLLDKNIGKNLTIKNTKNNIAENESIKHKDVIYYYSEYINHLREYNDKSYSIRKASYLAFSRYKQYHRKSTIQFNEINKNFILDFRQYVINIEDKKDITARNYIASFSLFLQDCVSNGIIDNHPFSRLTAADKRKIYKYEEKEVEALTLAEVKRIQELDLSNYKRLYLLRDIFILQCHIGCRISDLQAGKFELKFESDNDGKIPYIKFLPVKTANLKNTMQTVALTSTAYSIYMSNCWRQTPTRANYNDAIKRLFKLAKIDKKPASHIARRTCETLCYQFQPNAYLSGIHIEGSSSVQRYLVDDIATKQKIRCMAFNEPIWRLDNNNQIKVIDSINKTSQIEEKEATAMPAEILELAKKIYAQVSNKNESKVTKTEVTIDLNSISKFLK